MRVAFLDAFSGISGDMTVGALLDAGLDIAELEADLRKLDFGEWAIRRETRERSGIVATKFVVEVPASLHHHHEHRAWRDIRRMLEASRLDEPVRERALRIFAKLAEAEGAVHGRDPEDVSFHEVGAIDSIIDVVGAAWGFVRHGVGEIVVSPLPVGGGLVKTQHGTMPVPPPATVELLRGFPVRPGDGEGELVTPTGAAIVAALGRPGTLPSGLTVEKIGYGAGDRELADRPNLLRILVGTRPGRTAVDELVTLEANVDDLNPEIWEYVFDRLFAEGARDVWLTAVQMKRGRPGTVVSVLCDPDRRDALAGILFAETSTLGIRVSTVERVRLERESREVETRFGRIRVKVARAPGGSVNVAPEYQDCRRAAAEAGVPLKIVYQEALAAALGGR